MEIQSRRRTLAQERAASAWKHVNDILQNHSKAADKYGTWARKLPSVIHTNGLGAATAFMLAKAKGDRQSGFGLLHQHVEDWLVSGYFKYPPEEQISLMDIIHEGDMDVYRRASIEAIEYGIWLRRYAEACDIGSEESDDGP